MARTPKDVTDAELAVLQALWDGGPATIRDLVEKLYPGGGTSESATVQKLCERLVAKRCVTRGRRRRPQVFAAAIDRRELIGRQLRSVAERLCAGSLTPLLTHLVEGATLTAQELRALRELVENLDAQGRRRGREK